MKILIKGKVFDIPSVPLNTSIEIIKWLIKVGMEYESENSGFLFNASNSLYVRAQTPMIPAIDGNNDKLFNYLFLNVIDEYLKSGIIKVENGSTYYCNTDPNKNPNKNFKKVNIGLTDEHILYRHNDVPTTLPI